MKLHKLIKKAEAFFDSKERARNEKTKDLKELLRKLRKHEKRLRERITEAPDKEEKLRLEKKLARAHAQRKKGIRLLREMRK